MHSRFSNELPALDVAKVRFRADEVVLLPGAFSTVLSLKTHTKASKAASFFGNVLLLNKLNFTKRTPLR